MPDPSTEVAVVPPERPALRMLRPVGAPAAMIAAQTEAREYIKSVLTHGVDYGTIPGVKKPTLLKPGAEKIVLGFGCAFGEPAIIEREIDHDRPVIWYKQKKVWNNAHRGDKSFRWEKESGESVGLYRYVVRVDVIDGTGAVRGSGVGSCSSMESKYIDRPRDSENTILKMATKRARADAVLTTFGLSEQFTQDVEDSPVAVATEDVAPPVSPRDKTWPNWPNFEHAGKKFRDIPTDVLTAEMKKARGRADKATADGDEKKHRLAQNLVEACEAELEARREDQDADQKATQTSSSPSEYPREDWSTEGLAEEGSGVPF